MHYLSAAKPGMSLAIKQYTCTLLIQIATTKLYLCFGFLTALGYLWRIQANAKQEEI